MAVVQKCKCQRCVEKYTTTDGRKLSMSLPPLVSGVNGSISRSKNCPFAKHQKAYLNHKGYTVNDIYSLNRHRGNTNNSTDGGVHLPPIEELTPRRVSDRSKKSETNVMWKPEDSVKTSGVNDALYHHLIRKLNSESKIPGHLQLRDTKSRRLGKGLTRAHIKELLSEETFNVPNVIYHDEENDIL